MLRRSLAVAVAVAATLLPAAAAGAHPGHGAPAGHAPAPTVLEGRLMLRHSDDFARGRATFEHLLDVPGGEPVRLRFPDGAPQVSAGARVRVRGLRAGGELVVSAGDTQVVSAATTLATATARSKRIAVVLLNFADDASQPYTPAYAAGVAFTNASSVAAYYRDVSWGGLTLTGDVYGWYTVPDANTTCAYSTWGASAMRAAAAAGVDLSTYDHVVFGFPSTSACGWSGMANMPGRYSYLNGTGGMSLRTMAHELGHNFGTHHASALSCTQSGVRVSLAATQSACTASEYGDPFSVMGSSTRWHTAFSLGNFGWLAPANTLTVTASGDYAIAPLEAYDPAAVQQLRIQRTTGSYLALELRQPSLSSFDPFAPTDPVVTGLSVRITPAAATRTQSQLVDANPGTTSFADAPLAAGRTLVDPLSGVLVTTLGVGPAGATVRVSLPAPAADTTAPSAPSALSAKVAKNRRVTLSWRASSDNVGVTGYTVSRNGVAIAAIAGTSYTEAVPAGAAAYEVVARDAAGNVSPPSNTVTVR